MDCEGFISSYDLLVRENRLDLLEVRYTIMRGLKERGLKEGLTDDLFSRMLVVSSFDYTSYN